MNISKEQIEAFCQNLESLEKDKKAIADEMSDCVASFASSYDVDKKAVTKFYKEWKDANKDRDAYIQIDLESDSLFQVAFPELV